VRRDRLLLVKHAAPRVVENLPASLWTLSDAGERQCEELYSRIAGYGPGAIFTSREPKAVQTSLDLGSRFELPVTPLPGLHENDRTGLPIFRDVAALDARMKAFFLRSSERVIGNETADEAHARFAGAIRDVLASTRSDATVVVAHGAVISLLVGRANRVDPYLFWRGLDFTSLVVVRTPSLELEEVVHPTPG